jgi:hypothetical protein
MLKNLLLLVVFCLFSVYSYSSEEEVTTENLLDEYTDQNINIVGNPYGMSGAEITTGNQTQGGGRRIYDLDLSEYTNTQSIEYGSTVYSHISNTRVASCANTTGDCRDDFSITVRLYEGETLQETYSHVYEGITWTGSRQFEFSQNVTEISFNSAELELYGIDRGYHSGYYGTGFSDPYFQLTYKLTDIISSILDTVEMEISNQTEVYDDIIDTFEIELETFDEEIMTFQIEVIEPEPESFEIELTTFEDDVEVEVEIVELEEMVEELDEPSVETVTPKEKVAQKIMAKVIGTGDQIAINNVKLAVMAQLADTQTFDVYQTKAIVDNNIDNYLLKTIEDSYGIMFEVAQNNIMENIINAQY